MIFKILSFVYKLIRLQRDFTFKETKITSDFKIQSIDGFANLQNLKITRYENLQGKWDNVGFKNNQCENLI